MYDTKPVPDRIRNGLYVFSHAAEPRPRCPIRSRAWAVVIAGVAALFPASAWSQLESGASVLDLDPSARASAMGHTGTSVFWGAFPDFYRNPALLGHHRGVHYEWSSTQLLPSLTDALHVRANRLTLGDWGIGATFSGQPISGLGGTLYDAGDLTERDQSGQPVGTYHYEEEIDTWGIGVNAIELTENLIGGGKGEHPISRFGDVSYGFASKDVGVFVGPLTSGDITAEMTTHDHGLLVRLTPYDSIDYEGLLPGLDRALEPIASGLRVDVTYGRAWINDDQETIEFSSGGSDPVARVERQGFALRAALGLPSAIEAELEARDTSWLASALSPILSVGLAWDKEQQTYGDAEGLELGSNGVEVTVFNVFSIRNGSYETIPNFQNPETADRNTWGYGLGFHVQGLGGVYFDRGEVALPASGLGNQTPTAFGLWVDPPGLWRAFH